MKKCVRSLCIVLTAAMLLTLAGCRQGDPSARTPRQILDGTNLLTWIGQKRSFVYEQLLLTDETVVLRERSGPESMTILLPIVQQPDFLDAMKDDEWGVELTFRPAGGSGEGRLCGFRLMAAYAGEDAPTKARVLKQKIDWMLKEEPSLIPEAGTYRTQEGAVITAELVEIEPQEWTDIFETLGQMDPSYTHMVAIDVSVPEETFVSTEDLPIQAVIPEEVGERQTRPILWLFRYAGAGYILLFIAVGLIIYFIRKKVRSK